MNVQKILIFSLLLSIIVGCSSSASYFIEPTYKETKISSPVTVVPIQKKWFSENNQHTFGYLSYSQQEAFNSFLEPLFSENISSKVYTIDNNISLNGDNFRYTELPIGNSTFETFIPSENEGLGEIVSKSRFIILLDQYYFRKQINPPSRSSYAGGETPGSTYLYFETKYVYWDKEKKNAVAWGTSNAKIKVNNTIEPSQYSVVLGRAIKNIAKWGPVKAKP